MADVLIIVMPCFNEEEVLPSTISRMSSLLSHMVAEGLVSSSSRLLFVDDGSKDRTWELLSKANESYFNVCALRLATNSGHQNALMAGIEAAVDFGSDMVITIDADLQDDTSVIQQMVSKYSEGYDIVYGVKRSRRDDSWFKRTTAQSYYKIMKAVGVDLVYNHADFRLLSSASAIALLSFGEKNLFLRGIVPKLSDNSTCIYYDLGVRDAGTSKYSMKKMIHLAVDGITSFTDRPVKALIWFGLLFLLVAFGILCYVLVVFFNGNVVSGWSSLMLSLWFIGGCVMIGLGVVGVYLGRVYIEVKNRPRYVIRNKLLK